MFVTLISHFLLTLVRPNTPSFTLFFFSSLLHSQSLVVHSTTILHLRTLTRTFLSSPSSKALVTVLIRHSSRVKSMVLLVSWRMHQMISLRAIEKICLHSASMLDLLFIQEWVLLLVLLLDQAAKEAIAAANEKAFEATFENCSEDLLAARELAASAYEAVAKSRKMEVLGDQSPKFVLYLELQLMVAS
ncbi:hypothetical protein V8G54_010654, partial [Vigna mungo]